MQCFHRHTDKKYTPPAHFDSGHGNNHNFVRRIDPGNVKLIAYPLYVIVICSICSLIGIALSLKQMEISDLCHSVRYEIPA